MIHIILLIAFWYLVIGTIILKVLDEDSRSIWFIFIWPLGLFAYVAISVGVSIFKAFKND